MIFASRFTAVPNVFYIRYTYLLIHCCSIFTINMCFSKSNYFICKTGEQQSDINARIGQSAYLPCELEPNNVTMGFEVTTQCGIVHSVKWYRGASRIFLYSGGPRTTQLRREGYTDRYDG